MKKYIGNVVVSSPNSKIDDCFKKCLNLTEIVSNVPTLIIGFENAKKNIKDFNILNKKYEDNMLWWTFSKTERRVDYEKDILDFRNYCINNITSNIKYHYINYVDLTYNKAKKCLNYINNDNEKYYYIDNGKFIFLYDSKKDIKSKHIYGFSLNTCAFFGIRKDKIISLLEKNPHNKRINNFFSIPNTIRRTIDNDIPSEIVLSEYF